MEVMDMGASRQVLDYIVAYKVDYDGLSPTYREIMRGCGLGSTSVVTYHINKLIDLGYLDRPLLRNGLMVVGGRWVPPERYGVSSGA